MKILYTYWTEPDGRLLGYLNEFPEHWTQGTDLEDLQAHLFDLFRSFSDETLPGIKRVAELDIA
ncbi:MAG: type II toxin-antitoxin system HicB family antitoxin [Opitutales bacterium]|nr:type II toxin-antitoxin system HicB family antitoxin [Opitutales bacterium]